MSGLEQKITAAWQKRAWWLWLFYPLTLLYACIMWLRKNAYCMKLLQRYQAPVPVMIIGNITVGGSGKTPLIIALVEYLKTQDVSVAVISRGYGARVDDARKPRLVTAASIPAEVGDEPCLIVGKTGVPMAVGSDRQASIACVLHHFPDTQLILSDDGLQHLRLARDIEWIVYDAARGLGSQQLLPTGFLREPATRLSTTTVIHHGDTTQSLHMYLATGALFPLRRTTSLAKDQIQPVGCVHAVCGIGFPERFFSSLADLGYEVIKHAFADHHDYALADLSFESDFPIVTTTKDAVKLKQLKGIDALNIWVLPVDAVMSPACFEQLHDDLRKVDVKMI